MQLAFLLALAFAILFGFTERTEGFPNDTKKISLKEIKEPKEIKESATASKDVKDAIKAAKEAKKNKKECAKDCGPYDPICAHDPSDPYGKSWDFCTECDMEVYNCETGSKLVMKSKGECTGVGGVRLS